MTECGIYLKEAVAGFFSRFRVIMKYCGIDNYGVKYTPLIGNLFWALTGRTSPVAQDPPSKTQT